MALLRSNLLFRVVLDLDLGLKFVTIANHSSSYRHKYVSNLNNFLKPRSSIILDSVCAACCILQAAAQLSVDSSACDRMIMMMMMLLLYASTPGHSFHSLTLAPRLPQGNRLSFRRHGDTMSQHGK